MQKLVVILWLWKTIGKKNMLYLHHFDNYVCRDADTSDLWKRDTTSEMDKSLLSLHLNPGHTVIMLGWLVLKYKSLHFDEDGERIIELFKTKPFSLLHSIISNSIFKVKDEIQFSSTELKFICRTVLLVKLY
jgi:hypothetical protein